MLIFGSKQTLDVCVIFGEKCKKRTFIDSETGFKSLVSWTGKIGIMGAHFCMESTGCYSEGVAEYLHNEGHKVSVVNPLLIKAFRTSKMVRQKTDSTDSEVIAKFCKQNNPPLWCPRSPEKKELHQINIRITSLKEELSKLASALEPEYLNNLVESSIHDQIAFVKNTIKVLEDESKRIIEGNEILRRQYELLVGIKGVGDRVALTILADMPNVSNFKTAKQYAAFDLTLFDRPRNQEQAS